MAQVKPSTPNSLLVLGAGSDSGPGECATKSKGKDRSERPISGGTKKYTLKREDSNNSLEILPPEGERNTKRKTSNKKSDDSGSSRRASDHNRPSSSSSRPSSSRASSSQSNSRPSSSSKRAPPVARPDSSSSWRTQTPPPTKQIPLQAVKRKQNVDQSFGDVDWDKPVSFTVARSSHTHKLPPSAEKLHDIGDGFEKLSLQSPSASASTVVSSSSGSHAESSKVDNSELFSSFASESSSSIAARPKVRDLQEPPNVSIATESTRSPISHQAWPDPAEPLASSSSHSRTTVPGSGNTSGLTAANASNNSSGAEAMPKIVDIEDSDEFDTDLSDDGDDKEEEEEQKIKAPNELLMEFLTCMMEEDYENAQKLCKMILLYEPDNPEALNFQNLIEEKMLLDEEETESEESDSDDDDDEDEDGDSESDEDEDDDDDEGEDEDADSKENQAEDKPIASPIQELLP